MNLVTEFHYSDGDVGAYDDIDVTKLWSQFSKANHEASHIVIRPDTEAGQLLSNTLHGAILHRSPNGSRVRSRAFVIFKRHRRNSATAVTDLAMLLENGQDVPVKRGGCYGSGNLISDQRRTSQKQERHES